MSQEVYRDVDGRVRMVIETRWYDTILAVAMYPFLWFLFQHPLQKLKQYQRIIKFCIVGGSSTLAGLVTLWVLTDGVGIHYMASNTVAMAVSTAIWFAGNALWTFKDRKTNGWSVPKLAIVRTSAVGLHMGLLALFVELFGMWYIAAAVLATLLEFIAQYVASNKWLWRHHGRQ